MTSQQKAQRRGQPQNIRLPLIGSFTNRDSSGTKDQRFINIFPETRKVEAIESTKIFLNKRPGLSLYKMFAAGEGRGVAWFRSKFYVIIGNTVYEDGTPPTAATTLSTSTGPVGMIVANSSTIGDYLFICDGTIGKIIKSNGSVITITNDSIRFVSIINTGSGYVDGTYSCSVSGGGGSGFAASYVCSGGIVTEINITNKGTGYTSSPSVGFPSGGGVNASAIAYLNDFPTPHIPTPTFIDGYILLPYGSDVYNCVLDTPDAWDSSNFLSAEIFPDSVVALARQNNQVVVFGGNSIEFFYDAANINGSPLSRNESTTIQMGCACPYAIYQNEKTFIFVAQSESGGRAVWQVEGFQPKKVSDEFIERIIDAETNPTACHGFGFRSMGHLFYLINLPTLNRTFVYDTEEKLWHEWSSWSSNTHNVFGYNHMVDRQQGAAYLLHKSTGCLCKLDPTAYTDQGDIITVSIITNRYDMDTYNRKFMSRVRLVVDNYENGTNNSIALRWTDDDYQTWSNWKTIGLTDENPTWFRLGSFRRRAFNVLHNTNNPFRAESIEIDFTEGVS